jgi:hypothetical protein
VHTRAITACDFRSRASLSAPRHIRTQSSSARRRHVGALECTPHRVTNACSEFVEVSMEYVEHADLKPEPISIARCRELLGEDAESMTDQDIEDIRRHAETMAGIVVEMYQEQCRASE